MLISWLIVLALFAGYLYFHPTLLLLANQVYWRHSAQLAQQAFETERRYLEQQASEIISSGLFNNYISQRDLTSLNTLVAAEMVKRGFNGLLVVDRWGVALARGYSSTRRGDLVFHTAEWSQPLVHGQPVAALVDSPAVINVWWLVSLF